MGELHLDIKVDILKRTYKVDANIGAPQVAYREKITKPVTVEYQHKKQTGGHGQFGDCKIRVAPLPRGSDFQFEDDIFGGAIPRQFVPAVEKGIQDARVRGFLAGYPMVDFKATVFDGSYHAVDSNELSFKMAGSLAFKDAMSRARPTILEPIMHVEVYAPNDFAGDLMGDLVGDAIISTDAPSIVKRDDGSWLVEGMLPLDELRETLPIGELPGEEQGYFQTLGGFVLAELGRLPQAGDKVEQNGFGFEVMDMDGNRVDKVLVTTNY